MPQPKEFSKALFIHRRDLRVQDNTALNEAVARSSEVLTSFIFDPIQIGAKNTYKSDRHVAFMIESLEDLQEQYKKVAGALHLYEESPHDIVEKFITLENIDAVFMNADYTPYSKSRDEKIRAVCEKHQIAFQVYHDLLLSEDPDKLTTDAGKPYTVFTPYWKKAVLQGVRAPKKLGKGIFIVPKTEITEVSLAEKMPDVDRTKMPFHGGRKEGRAILQSIEQFYKYADTRNDPSKPTTRLSAHNKFGTVSIREVYHACGKDIGYHSALTRQLYWRDFYTSIVHFFPRVVGSSYDESHNKLFWNKTARGFTEWKEGKTGFPLVDAGMRELAETGYMHNRVRLVVGSFLTKDLHIYWEKGEQYFAQQLIDYDLSVNNGNWQWVAGTGTDPVPYFRIFNPWLQSKRFDPEANYIKRWVPELKDVPPAQIHALDKKPLPKDHPYVQPMITHADEVQKVRALYKK